jgi:hypothetical protein
MVGVCEKLCDGDSEFVCETLEELDCDLVRLSVWVSDGDCDCVRERDCVKEGVDVPDALTDTLGVCVSLADCVGVGEHRRFRAPS